MRVPRHHCRVILHITGLISVFINIWVINSFFLCFHIASELFLLFRSSFWFSQVRSDLSLANFSVSVIVITNVSSCQEAKILWHEAFSLLLDHLLLLFAFKAFSKDFFQRTWISIHRSPKDLTFCFTCKRVNLLRFRRQTWSWKLAISLKLIVPRQVHLLRRVSQQTPRTRHPEILLAFLPCVWLSLLVVHHATDFQVIFGRECAWGGDWS